MRPLKPPASLCPPALTPARGAGEHSSNHHQLDLTDRELCQRTLRSPEFGTVTQVVFTALYGNDVWDEEERKVNLAMLQNVLVSTTPHHPNPIPAHPNPNPFSTRCAGDASYAVVAGQEPVLEVAKGTLRHVDLMQGRKAYPSQVRPRPTLHLLDGSQQIAGC